MGIKKYERYHALIDFAAKIDADDSPPQQSFAPTWVELNIIESALISFELAHHAITARAAT